MAAAVDHHHHNHLRPTPLPLIDVRLLSHTELLSLSRYSSASTTTTTSATINGDEDQDSTPKIDATVFNESAGSRKQTFSRLRLAPRNSSPLRPQIPPPSSTSAIEDNSEVISALTSLLHIDSDSFPPQITIDVDDDPLFPVPVELEKTVNEELLIGPQNIPVELVTCSETKRKRGRPRKNDTSNSRWVISTSTENQVSEPMAMAMTMTLALTPSIDGSSVKRKRGRPRKNHTQNVLALVSPDAIVAVTDNNSQNMSNGGGSEAVACETRKRKPGRPRKDETLRRGEK